jgi:hypothetical protein
MIGNDHFLISNQVTQKTSAPQVLVCCGGLFIYVLYVHTQSKSTIQLEGRKPRMCE